MSKFDKIQLTIAVAALVVSCVILAAIVIVPRTTSPAPVVTAVAPTATPEPAGKYYFLAGNNSDPFYVPGVAGFKAAAKELGVKAEFVGPMDASMQGQIDTWNTLLASPDTKGIFLYAFDYKAEESLVKETKAKGIPLVFGAADSPYRTRDAFIGYDNTLLGTIAADYAMKLCPECKTFGSIGVNGANVIERRDAFMKRLKDAGKTVYETSTNDGSADGRVKSLDTYMTAHPDMDLLWFADGGAGLMATPFKEKQQAGSKTLFLATDMPDNTLQAVKDGVFVGTVGQDTFTEERVGMQMLYDLSKGLKVPDTTYLNALLIDKSNVDQYKK
jgi:ABC-type sugar transport system substrate-binding protein